MSKGKKRSGARPGRPQPLRGTKGKRKGARLWYVGVNNFNCRGFGPLLEDKLCLIFKLAPSVCRMTFPILASLLVRLVALLPFQLLRLSLATPSRWTPLALSVFLHCVVALLLTRSEERFSRNAETDLVCRLLLEKKKKNAHARSSHASSTYITNTIVQHCSLHCPPD